MQIDSATHVKTSCIWYKPEMLPNRFHIFYWHWSPLYFCPLAGRCGRAHWLTEWMLRWHQRIWKRLRTLRQRSKRSLSLPCQSRFTLTLNPSLRCCLIHVGSLPSFRVATLQMLKAWPRSIWWRRPFRSLRTGHWAVRLWKGPCKHPGLPEAVGNERGHWRFVQDVPRIHLHGFVVLGHQ